MFSTAKESIKNKNLLKKKHSAAFEIVKKYIDKLDPMGLLEWSAPPDEYDIETAEILTVALRSKDTIEITDAIISVFGALNERNLITRENAIETATKIFVELENFNNKDAI